MLLAYISKGLEMQLEIESHSTFRRFHELFGDLDLAMFGNFCTAIWLRSRAVLWIVLVALCTF